MNSSDVTIAVLNYNGIQTLPKVLKSISHLYSLPGEILLVDDGSSDSSVSFVREHFPKVRIVEMGGNTKLLNKVRNKALRESKHKFIFIVDNDITLKSDCLEQLIWGMENLPDAAVCMPRVLYADDPSLIYQDGQTLHYVGATSSENRDITVDVADSAPRISIGCGMKLIDKVKAAEIGFFNEEYVMGWGDDGEFDQKMNIVGYRCYHIPAAIVYHERIRGAQRYYGTVRNRWRFILECYHWKTLLLCFPALLLYEFALCLFLITKGALSDYINGVSYVIRNRNSIWNTRQTIQSRRKKMDSDLMRAGPLFVYDSYINSRVLGFGLSFLNSLLNGYWHLVKNFV